MQKHLLLITLLIVASLSGFTQVYNGKHLIWKLPDETDTRFTALFGSTGRSFGSEGCSVSVTSRTEKKLYIEFSLVITDFCGQSTTRKITRTVEPGKTAGNSPWFDGFDYSTKCEQNKKYGENFYTRIQSIELTIVKVTELAGKNNGSNSGNSGNNNSSNNSGSNSNSGNTNNSNNSGSGNGGNSNNSSGNSTTYGNDGTTITVNGKSKIVKHCTPIGFGIHAGYACANISWSVSTGTNMFYGDTLIQHIEASDFIFKWRKKGDLVWREVKTTGQLMTIFNINPLEPCTKYEGNLIRICDKGVLLESGIKEFTTDCNSPEVLTVSAYTRTTAKINYRIRSSIPCGLTGFSYVGVVEYKAPNGAWETIVCVPREGCELSALQPGTTYRVRARFRYNNSTYSEYSKEVSFTTSK